MKSFKSILLSLVIILAIAFGVACNTPSTPAPKVYDVYFETFGYSDAITQEVKENECAVRPSPEPVSDTHNFIGWYTDMSFTTEFDFTTPITQDIDIYAKWTEKESTYTINFDKNGHGKAPAKQFIEAGTNGKITKPNDLSANGWKFLGWSLDKDGADNLIDFETFIPSSSITLYAQWKQIFTVSFDLNNEEALIATPDSQSIEDGQLAIKPNDPVVTGFKFNGWFIDKECTQAFDFNSPIEKRTALYANWTKTAVGTIDGSDLPAYEWERDAAYGERPDLEGFVIDGKMGAEENWEEQKWYHNGITEAPTVSYDISTQFSEKGLYVFLRAYDNGGLAFTGRGYHYKNTGWNFWIGHAGESVYSSTNNVFNFVVDTYSVKGDYWCVKMAINITEGVVNPIGDNKYGSFNVEMFVTWDEIGLEQKPESINIFPQYKYKRIQSATSTLSLAAPFAGSMSTPTHYIPFNGDGYMLADAQNAVVGDSSLGIAKTSGWDISHESDATDAYVQTTIASSTIQALFFKGITDSYYEVETEIDPTNASMGGRAGIMVYSSKTLYSMMTAEIMAGNVQDGKFVIVRPRLSLTDKDGILNHRFFDPIEVADGKVVLKLIFADGYMYYILNDKLFHCEFVENLNVRTNPALVAENCSGVRFKNYKATVHTRDSVDKETSKYAYVIRNGRLSNLSITYSSTGVSIEGDNEIILYPQHGAITFSSATRDEILNNNDFSGIVRMYELDTLSLTVNDETTDITNIFTDAQNGAKYGEFVLKNIKGNVTVTNTSRLVPTENLTAIIVPLKDNLTGGDINVAASVTIKSNNPRLSNYSSTVTQSCVVAVVQKGYDYELTISAIGYRAQTLSRIYNVTDRVELDPVVMVNTVVGGTATSKTDSTFTISSGYDTWDYTHEDDGYIIMETQNFQRGDAYYTGDTIARYQVAEVNIANIIDVSAYAKYEGDPAAGFAIVNKAGKRSFIGLHRNGLRVLKDTGGGWNPIHYHTMGYSIINKPSVTGDVSGRLTMIKIDKETRADCYMFIDGIFITKVELEGRGGETAIGFAITSSYYSKIKFFDYWIKTGDEAIEKAKELGAVNFILNDDCYDINDDYETDYTKPCIEFSGHEEVLKEDGKIEKLGLVGNTMKVSLTPDYIVDGVAYTVKIGDMGSVILTSKTPSATFAITGFGEHTVSMEYATSSTVEGNAVLITGEAIGCVEGNLVDDDGKKISFTTGEDGSFSVDVYASKNYTVTFYKDGYVCKSYRFASGAVSTTKNIGDIYLYDLPLGSQTPAGLRSGVGVSYGYGYDDGANKIDGIYAEIDATGDNGQAYHKELVEDVIVKFSYFRKEIPDIEKNEHNPAIGIRLVSNSKAEFYGFWQDGTVMLPADIGWNDRRPVLGVMGGKVSEYDKAFDFVIVRKGMNISLYGKVASDSEYKYITTYTSTIAFGKASMFIHCTNGNPNNYFLYNIDIQKYSTQALPSFMVKTPTISSTGNGTYSFEGSSIDEEGKFAVGDTVTVSFVANAGFVPAYVKVDGKLMNVVDGKVTFSITNDISSIEIVFEKEYNTYNVVATVNSPAQLNAINVVALLEDGRDCKFENVAVTDGKVSLAIREDVVKMYAYTDTYGAKMIPVSVSENGQNVGTLDLSLPLIGSVNVNGKTLTTPENSTWDFDFETGEYNNNSYGSYNWIQNSTTSGDFILEASITLSHGNVNSKYYSPDRATGFVMGDGTKMFSVLFQANGFRICGGGWSTTEMVETHNGKGDWFVWGDDKDTTRSLRIVRIGASFKLYVDGVLEATVDTTNGVVSAYGGKPNTTGGTGDPVACNEWIKQRVADMFGSSENEIAFGVVAHIGGNIYNNAGIGNLKIITDESVIAQYK